ncbi:hypothetical protein EOPP23_13095 [Endozoicomonas sp. OPT23]|uniref:rod-binding protein n=1 Tax=Endozoicomonas sp. OPT23 TaxID=2072845 RepID=UPI00129A1E77|nr:rod-binding protein [Endozoicomonas sp. OPT23]MRI33925.1 hypothetical protein [Endozoicomonas sp. OPT23]
MSDGMLNTDVIALQSRSMFDQARPVVRGRNDSEALQEVAQDFEALMMEQMMKSMRKAGDVFAEDSPFTGSDMKMWQEWQDTQLSIEMSRTRGLGLAEQIIAQVEKRQG